MNNNNNKKNIPERERKREKAHEMKIAEQTTHFIRREIMADVTRTPHSSSSSSPSTSEWVTQWLVDSIFSIGFLSLISSLLFAYTFERLQFINLHSNLYAFYLALFCVCFYFISFSIQIFSSFAELFHSW